MSAIAESERKLESLRLRGASSKLPELLKLAESEGMTCLAFLESLVDVDLKDRGYPAPQAWSRHGPLPRREAP